MPDIDATTMRLIYAVQFVVAGSCKLLFPHVAIIDVILDSGRYIITVLTFAEVFPKRRERPLCFNVMSSARTGLNKRRLNIYICPLLTCIEATRCSIAHRRAYPSLLFDLQITYTLVAGSLVCPPYYTMHISRTSFYERTRCEKCALDSTVDKRDLARLAMRYGYSETVQRRCDIFSSTTPLIPRIAPPTRPTIATKQPKSFRNVATNTTSW